MIRSWANASGRRFFKQGKSSKFRGMDKDTAQELPAMLDAAASLTDPRLLRGSGLHRLTGDRKGQWTMTVNGPWRICFRCRKGEAYDVAIIDYHKG